MKRQHQRSARYIADKLFGRLKSGTHPPVAFDDAAVTIPLDEQALTALREDDKPVLLRKQSDGTYGAV